MRREDQDGRAGHECGRGSSEVKDNSEVVTDNSGVKAQPEHGAKDTRAI